MGRTSKGGLLRFRNDGKLEMNTWAFLREVPFFPVSIEGKQMKASNSEKRRWLQNKAVLINGERPGPDDWIVFPIEELVFFPKGKRRTTIR